MGREREQWPYLLRTETSDLFPCSVEVVDDTKIPNAVTVIVKKQDHTLANMIRACVPKPHRCQQSESFFLKSRELLQSPSVLFAGYKVPHPLHPYFEIKIQTVSSAPTANNPTGTVTPVEVLEKTCQKLIGTLSNLEAQFKREFAYRDVSGGDADTGEYGGGASAGAWGATGRGDYLDF